MKQVLIAAGIVGLAFTGGAQAYDTFYGTGNELLPKCKLAVRMVDGQEVANWEQSAAAGECLAFVEGGSQMLQIVTDAGIPWICFPEGWTVAQGTRVFVEYMEKNPDALNNAAGALLLWSYTEAWECRSTQSGLIKR